VNAMAEPVRVCPRCGFERRAGEAQCENSINGESCGWDLLGVPLTAPRGDAAAAKDSPVPAQAQAPARVCSNGHPVPDGDQLCLQCGTAVQLSVGAPAAEPRAPLEISGWHIDQPVPGSGDDSPFERFYASDSSGRQGVLTWYRTGVEPDPAVHEVLRRMPRDHIPELFATGRFELRAWEVFERIEGGSLADADLQAYSDPELLKRIIDELGRALAAFADWGLRHRNLRPDTIHLRTREPLDIVISGFGSARLSDFDLEAVAPLEVTRYSAPEAIVGGVSASSDWWSLGMIVLELVTRGEVFTGTNERAFQLHVVTRGVEIPTSVDGCTRALLRGLLTRDPQKRWGWRQVSSWLSGADVSAPEEEGASSARSAGPAITLETRVYHRPEDFALAAAESATWDAARELTLRGAVATWLDSGPGDKRIAAEARRLATDESLSEDFRHALVLMAMNRSLPLALRGEIVTPAWLLAHPEVGYEMVTGEVSRHLHRLEREPWICRLRDRAEAVRSRARSLEVALNEERARVTLLATSRANLESERALLRRLYPDTDHAGLAALMERPRLSDEDLIVLLSAADSQFIPLATVVDHAAELAARLGLQVDRAVAAEQLAMPRREMFAGIDARIASFARCGISKVDEWADAFRVDRRMPLPRAVVLLSLPPERWTQPPRQEYVSNLLSHFEKRVSGAVQRGPLVLFSIGKTTARIDLTELETASCPAQALLDHVLSREEIARNFDPAAFDGNDALEGRLRRLINHAATFRRDTGIDGRYLGFPFLAIRDARLQAANARARVAPVLLWPVAIDIPFGRRRAVPTLMFDRDREEIRLNPALEAVLGPQVFAKWKEAREELLCRSSFRTAEVMDAFGGLATPKGRTLTRIPSKDWRLEPGAMALIPAAGLFNAEFSGQAIAEDLRQMKRMPPAGTALDATLRVGPQPAAPTQPVSERECYLTVDSDPSQDAAVYQARLAPGLLVEGPPGTGKSQSIVNIVADSIGRGETVLVVCQKQAALRVVEKRLEGVGLSGRLCSVVDANRDRESILREIRAQLDHLRGSDLGANARIRAQRDWRIARIEALEAELDRQHQALYSMDEKTGLGYRTILGDLIRLEEGGPLVNVPHLRPRFASLTSPQVTPIEETCSSLAPLWLASRYEGSALGVLREFQVDDAIEDALSSDLRSFEAAESHRAEVLRGSAPSFEVEDPAPYLRWLDSSEATLSELDETSRQRLAAWYELFKRTEGTVAPPGYAIIVGLEEQQAALEKLDERLHDSALSEPLSILPFPRLAQLLICSASACEPPSFFGKVNPVRWSRVRRAREYLAELGESAESKAFERLRGALELERQLRPIRGALASAAEALHLPPARSPTSLAALKVHLASLLGMLTRVRVAAAAADCCPNTGERDVMALAKDKETYRRAIARVHSALARHAARESSRKALQPLSSWFSEDWIRRMDASLALAEPTQQRLEEIRKALPTLRPYQAFRARTASVGSEVLAVFAELRRHEAELGLMAAHQLRVEIGRIIRREALLSWKSRLESLHPELLLDREETESRARALELEDRETRKLNQALLAGGVEVTRLGTVTQWEAITRLRGPRAKRLRELVDEGGDLGLMSMRPIWLMNPDVASRVLPLKPGLFDLVVYDEASQMPVEHAIPTLFRAKRVVISGDEKQMPPTSFFSSRIDDDEDEFDPEEVDEEATESERAAHEDQWTRREITSCPDLLELGRWALPKVMLQIHYRSKYRELISFSNAAYYRDALNVPARHPEEAIREARPITVVRVEGTYGDQTNAQEAVEVVRLLSELWKRPPEMRPTLGVVTFNRKQADLIEEGIEKLAADDADFRRAFEAERDRKIGGQDVGFFVKNVENVQGDERDWMLFSTTFGRDSRGAFRRSFGVLGQAGGERRLNVAVTRAKERILLVTSIPIADVSDRLAAGRAPARARDFLQAYLDYATKVSDGQLDLARSAAARLSGRAEEARKRACEVSDGLVDSVGRFIRALGHEPVLEEAKDAFGLEIAIRHPRTGIFGIGIECDSPRHPLLARARAREVWRRQVLKCSVPHVYRVVSRAWYHDAQAERTRLKDAIEQALS
jgi:primosomal replication protein N''